MWVTLRAKGWRSQRMNVMRSWNVFASTLLAGLVAGSFVAGCEPAVAAVADAGRLLDASSAQVPDAGLALLDASSVRVPDAGLALDAVGAPDLAAPDSAAAEPAEPDAAAPDGALDAPGADAGASAAVDVAFPQDRGPHAQRSEWWYYTGHLSDGEARWGFELCAFQYDAPVLGMTYMCHVAVTDLAAGAHHHYAQIKGRADQLEPDRVVVGQCTIELGEDGADHVTGLIPLGQERHGGPSPWRLDLDLVSIRRPTFHGGNGVIDMGAGGSQSWYYSYTRQEAEGTLQTPAGERAVSGLVWMDHQWGGFDINEFKGWDWWSIQLDDRWDIMLFQFRDWDGALVSQAGTVVDAAGNQVDLMGLDSFSVTSRRSWQSPHTGGVYPLDWDIAIEGLGLELRAVTSVDDQEMDNPVQNYWEGETTITGTRGTYAVSGVGYTELTGYAVDLLDPPR